MLKDKLSKDDLKPSPLTVNVETHITEKLAIMSKNTKRPIDDLVQTALKMFIATHNDFLGHRR